MQNMWVICGYYCCFCLEICEVNGTQNFTVRTLTNCRGFPLIELFLVAFIKSLTVQFELYLLQHYTYYKIHDEGKIEKN